MKKIFKIILILVLFISFNNVYASTKTYERNSGNNYGVKKDYQISETMLEHIKKTKYVNADEKIYDFSDILTDDEEKELYSKIQEFIEKTNMDLVILTDNVPYNYDEENEDYAVDFYDYNDFGMNNEKYDGVIFFRNTYPNDRYYGIYMTGNAQLYFTDDRNDSTLDSIYYYISGDSYLAGITMFIDDFTRYYETGIPEQYSNSYIDDNGNLIYVKKYHPPFIFAGVLSLIVTIITIAVMVSKNKMVYKAREANEYLDKNSIKYNRKDSHLVSSNTTRHYNPPSSSSSGGGSSHSFSGSSGSGHSGGGRHG